MFAIQHLSGIRILEIEIFNPGIRIVQIAVEQVLAVIVIRFQIRLLNLVADKFGVARRQRPLDEIEILLLQLIAELLAPDRLLQHPHQMHGIGADFARVIIEGGGQHLEGKAR